MAAALRVLALALAASAASAGRHAPLPPLVRLRASAVTDCGGKGAGVHFAEAPIMRPDPPVPGSPVTVNGTGVAAAEVSCYSYCRAFGVKALRHGPPEL